MEGCRARDQRRPEHISKHTHIPIIWTVLSILMHDVENRPQNPWQPTLPSFSRTLWQTKKRSLTRAHVRLWRAQWMSPDATICMTYPYTLAHIHTHTNTLPQTHTRIHELKPSKVYGQTICVTPSNIAILSWKFNGVLAGYRWMIDEGNVEESWHL